MSSSNGAVLSVEGLRTGFGAHAVLHGVDLEVPDGQITAILGLNGAGKSVTLKTISGVIPAWAGTVRFKGEDITSLDSEDRIARGMAHVLQGRAVFSNLTVEENLKLGGATVKDRAKVRASIEEMYQRFPRLRERRDQLGGNLSGGEQEMLAVGRALMSSPSLILVDEASQGLAPIAVEHLFETLKEVNRSGVTMLMVEQNVSFTLGIADHILVMQKGEIVYSGESASLDREKLASLLGIGALLRKVAAPSAQEPEVAELTEAKPKAKRKTAAKPRPKLKTKATPKAKAAPRTKAAPKTKASTAKAKSTAKRTPAKR